MVFCSCVWQSLGIKCRLKLHCGLGNDNLCVCGALVILALEAELTLAVGQEYLQSSENFAVSFNNITPFFSLFLTFFLAAKHLVEPSVFLLVFLSPVLKLLYLAKSLSSLETI